MSTTTHESRVRWGGALLAIAILLTTTSLVLFMTRPGGADPDPAARAAAYAANAGRIQAEGFLGALGYAFLAVAALFLAGRNVPNVRGWPSGPLWTIVGLGAVVLMATEILLATALLALAPVYAAETAIYGAIGLLTTALAGFGLLALGLGGALVLATEAQLPTSPLPRIVAYIGVLGAVLTIVAGVVFFTGPRSLVVVTGGAALANVAFVWLGVKLGFPSLGEARDATPQAVDA